jgi:hypothetical protein
MFGRHAGILPHNISSLVLELAIFYQFFAAFFLRNRYIISCTRTRHGVPSVLSVIRRTSSQKSLQERDTFFGGDVLLIFVLIKAPIVLFHVKFLSHVIF